jgi:hypothetical protein
MFGSEKILMKTFSRKREKIHIVQFDVVDVQLDARSKVVGGIRPSDSAY